jgi:hypothetical protein
MKYPAFGPFNMVISSASKKPFEDIGVAGQGQADNRGVNDGAVTQEEIDELEFLVFRRVSDVLRRT